MSAHSAALSDADETSNPPKRLSARFADGSQGPRGPGGSHLRPASCHALFPIIAASLVVFAAPTGADAEVFQGATLTVEHRVRLQDLTFSTFDPHPGDDDQVVACNGGTFTQILASGSFHFREDMRETGCGEARTVVAVPVGSDRLRLAFNATREVRQAATSIQSVPMDVRQEVHLYDHDGRLVERVAYYAPDDRTIGAKRVDLVLDVPPGSPTVQVAWWFEDHGASPAPGLPGASYGFDFVAQIDAPMLVFPLIPLEPNGPPRSDVSVQGDLRTTRHIYGFQVSSEVWNDTRGAANLVVRLDERVDVSHVIVPGGERIGTREMAVDKRDGILQATVPGPVMARYGPGLYTLVVASAAPVQLSPPIAPFALAAVCAPVATGLLGLRAVRMYDRFAFGPFRESSKIFRAAFALAAAFYAFVLWLVFVRGRLRLMASWPLGAEGGLLYGLVFGAFVAFLLIYILADRNLVGALRDDVMRHQKAQRQLQAQSEEMKDFVYAVSHDLKTPLVAMEWLLQELDEREGPQKTAEAQETIDRLRASVHDMEGFIQELLRLLRVGHEPEPAEPVDLAVLVRSLFAETDRSAQEKGVRLTADWPTLPIVLAHEARMRHVLANLIENAIKYGTAENGRVNVRARPLHPTSRRPGVRLVVEDNGPGVPDVDKERVFQIFQRGASDQHGTGIGLAMVRKIAGMYGGKARVVDARDAGARFEVDLPVRTRPAADPGLLVRSPRPWRSLRRPAPDAAWRVDDTYDSETDDRAEGGTYGATAP